MSNNNRQKIQKVKTSRMHIRCPNCESPMYGSRFERLSCALTKVLHRCSNPLCNMTCVGYHEIKRITQKPMVVVNTQMNIELSPVAKATAEALSELSMSNDSSDLNLIKDAMPQGDMFFELGVQDYTKTLSQPPPGFPTKAHNTS